jgi:hypothetical protein
MNREEVQSLRTHITNSARNANEVVSTSKPCSSTLKKKHFRRRHVRNRLARRTYASRGNNNHNNSPCCYIFPLHTRWPWPNDLKLCIRWSPSQLPWSKWGANYYCSSSLKLRPILFKIYCNLADFVLQAEWFWPRICVNIPGLRGWLLHLR